MTPDEKTIAEDRKRLFQRAWDHYQGTPKRPLKVMADGIDDNLIISLARLIVDKSASFLFGQDVLAQLTDDGAEAQQLWLDECWRRNKRGIVLLKLATNGGIFGHVFARLLPPNGIGQYPRLINLDPQIVTVMTDPDDCDTVWQFIVTPPPVMVNGTEEQRRTVFTTPSAQAGYQVDSGGWLIIEQVFVSTPTPTMPSAGDWQDVNSTEWPYDFSPIVHCQNLPKANEFWGESDLPEDILQILDGINRVASHYAKIIRHHAHPKVYTSGMGKQRINTAIDSIIHLPSETAKLGVLEMQSDLSSTMALLEKLLGLLAMMTRIPLVAMGESDDLGPTSGVALQIRFQPLIEKTEAKRRTFGDLLVEADRCLLSMGGFGEDNITTQQWPEVLPVNSLEERQVAVLDDSLGIASKETLSSAMGYDFEEETRRIEDEHKAAVAAGLTVQPGEMVDAVPAPAAIPAPNPDVAKKAKSV